MRAARSRNPPRAIRDRRPARRGRHGEVFRARDTRLNREVAIKVLPAAMALDLHALQRMGQEARVVAALNHPNLLSVHDIGQTPEGSPFIVTELLEGESLRHRLQSGALGQPRAVDYGEQIARGMAAAHDKGVTHRDLKPENIFLTQDGRVKILDFGLAKLNLIASSEDVTAAAPAAATAPGVVLGTAAYMAPEQVRGQPTDARSDIFSLGAVLYEMLAGRRAFRGSSAADVMSSILKEDPEPLVASSASSTGPRRELSPALDAIVLKKSRASAFSPPEMSPSISPISPNPARPLRFRFCRTRAVWAGRCWRRPWWPRG